MPSGHVLSNNTLFGLQSQHQAFFFVTTSGETLWPLTMEWNDTIVLITLKCFFKNNLHCGGLKCFLRYLVSPNFNDSHLMFVGWTTERGVK
jgi:hypothetical protein